MGLSTLVLSDMIEWNLSDSDPSEGLKVTGLGDSG